MSYPIAYYGQIETPLVEGHFAPYFEDQILWEIQPRHSRSEPIAVLYLRDLADPQITHVGIWVDLNLPESAKDFAIEGLSFVQALRPINSTDLDRFWTEQLQLSRQSTPLDLLKMQGNIRWLGYLSSINSSGLDELEGDFRAAISPRTFHPPTVSNPTLGRKYKRARR